MSKSVLFFLALVSGSGNVWACNGHKVGWCSDYYKADQGWIVNHTLPTLRARQTALSPLITGKRYEIDVARQKLAGQTQLNYALVGRIEQARSYQDLVETFLLPRVDSSIQNYQKVSSALIQHLPELIAAIRSWTTTRDYSLDFRLAEVEAALSSRSDEARTASLLYEKKILEDLIQFQKQFLLREDFDRVIQEMRVGTFSQEKSQLSPEAIAFVKVVANIGSFSSNSAELLSQIRIDLEILKSDLLSKLSILKSQTDSAEAELKNSREALASIGQEITQYEAQLSSLVSEANGLPERISRCATRVENDNIYWNACDDAPACFQLPDAGGTYSTYEAHLTPGRAVTCE